MTVQTTERTSFKVLANRVTILSELRDATDQEKLERAPQDTTTEPIGPFACPTWAAG